jgi:DNA-binding IscR family transcriptional regulator
MIGEVIRVLDGPLAPIRCASRTAYEPCDDCKDPISCQIRVSMTQVRDAIAAILDNMPLSQFVAGEGAAGDLLAFGDRAAKA